MIAMTNTVEGDDSDDVGDDAYVGHRKLGTTLCHDMEGEVCKTQNAGAVLQ